MHILTIGSAVRDIFLTSSAFTVVRSSSSREYTEHLALGSKIDIDDCIFSTGGGATNAAATFARLGFSSEILTKIGDDEPGHAILSDLKTRGIHSDLVLQNKKWKTGYSTILTAPDGERTVLVFRGVSGDWHEKDIPRFPKDCRAIYLTSLGGNFSVLEKILRNAKKQGIRVACNPGNLELRHPGTFLQLLPLISVLLLNKDEARMLTGKKSGDTHDLLARLARHCETVVITNGAEGSYACTQKTIWFARASKQVKSRSRTGAGDAFGSAFFATLLKEASVSAALQVGTLNAEHVIQHVGAKTGILSAWPSTLLRSRIHVTSQRLL